MKLSELKQHLTTIEKVRFTLPNGTPVPRHFHVTEVGKVTKHFIDCGGTERMETVVNLQLWTANDILHRLQPEKLSNILEISEQKLNIADYEIEVEYQGDTISKYGLDFNGKEFVLTTKSTDCLAKDLCGIAALKPKVNLAKLTSDTCYTPKSGCC